MPSKRWKSTSSDRRRWLHMPSWTYGQSTMNFRSSRNFNKVSTEKIAEVRFAFKSFVHRIMSCFHGVFATGVASQQGTLTLPDIWFRPPFWYLLVLQLLRQDISNLPCLYSTFHLENPLILSRFRLLLFMATYLLSVFSATLNVRKILTSIFHGTFTVTYEPASPTAVLHVLKKDIS